MVLHTTMLYFRILFQSIQVLSKMPVYESHDLTEVYRCNRETCFMQLQGLPRKWKQHQITLHHISGDNHFYGHCHTKFKSQCMNTFWMCYVYTSTYTLWERFQRFKIMACAFGAPMWNIHFLKQTNNVLQSNSWLHFLGTSQTDFTGIHYSADNISLLSNNQFHFRGHTVRANCLWKLWASLH